MKTSKSVILSRQDEILSYIQRNNYIKISELAKAFGVSTATIRRDISTLEESGEDIRCKGGICIADTGNALPKFDNERYFSSHTQEKEAIARKTAEFIEDGDTIFINGSSTAFRIIPHIKGKSVTIITNNGQPVRGQELRHRPHNHRRRGHRQRHGGEHEDVHDRRAGR